MLRLSFGELLFYSCRAAFGAGLPWGLAEDAAATATWLAGRGEDPAPMLAEALQGLVDGTAGTAVKHDRQGVEHVLAIDGPGPLSALAVGPSAADWWQVLKHDPAARLRVVNTDVPGWVIACVAARTGVVAQVGGDVDGPGDVVFQAPDMSGARGATFDAATQAPVTQATVDAEAWGVVQHCFRLSLVPSTDASRAGGAGAGLVDTD
jgi:hypothetical protein